MTLTTTTRLNTSKCQKVPKNAKKCQKMPKMVKTPCLAALFCDFGKKRGGVTRSAKNVKKCKKTSKKVY